MVIGLLTITSIPTITGVAEAISAQKKQNASSKEQEKIHLTAKFCGDNPLSHEQATCFLKDGKVSNSANISHDQSVLTSNDQILLEFPGEDVQGHKFCGFHFKYPGEEQHLGLVSSIQDEPPMLNWIYVNRQTQALEYGARKDTIGHIIGPWGWSEDERFLTLEGSPGGFMARKQKVNGVERWILHWDPEVESDDEDEEPGRVGSVLLHRRPVFGVESSYVRDGE
jgi:hypothetical protein